MPPVVGVATVGYTVVIHIPNRQPLGVRSHGVRHVVANVTGLGAPVGVTEFRGTRRGALVAERVDRRHLNVYAVPFLSPWMVWVVAVESNRTGVCFT